MVAFIHVSKHLFDSIFIPENETIVHRVRCWKRGDFTYTKPKSWNRAIGCDL